jgi:YVTN family beta-propeller protein
MRRIVATALTLAALGAPSTSAQPAVVNWESPHVHPLELTPDGMLLLAVNTVDARLEVFDVASGAPTAVASVPVGLDPVSVRARSATEAWVVNRVSDSISVVDLSTFHVKRTLPLRDEPADVVFAGTPERAFVSSEGTNEILVFDPANLGAVPIAIAVGGLAPRALAVSADRGQVFAAIFLSGNATTILGGGRLNNMGAVPNVVSDPLGPYGGTNPPPNSGIDFTPPLRSEYEPTGATPAPPVGLIVRQRFTDGRWLDDNVGNWTPFVSGAQSQRSGRLRNWNLPDRDVAIIDTATLAVTHAQHLMNLVMGLAVHPTTGRVTVVGTEATNEIRFEPNVKSRFVRVELARFHPATPTLTTITDLNASHLDYSDAQVAAQAEPGTADPTLRAKSLGDPRAILWTADGSRGYVAGLGSNNVIVIDELGQRLPLFGNPNATSFEVGQGPTGLALDSARQRLYVLNRFAGSISAVDTTTESVVTSRSLYDPSPAVWRAGRRHLYDTRATSGLGQASCASCHVDGRMDRLAWDLGNPAGDVKAVDGAVHNLNNGQQSPAPFTDFHPMKGPMTTQTLQDIIGKEPHHWRGDKNGIEEFNGAFRGLLGDDLELTETEMQEFEDFLASVRFPPNPYRPIDNTLPALLPLPGHFATGRFANQGGLAAGAPLPAGNAQNGLAIYRPPRLLDAGARACSGCHSLPTGAGGDVTLLNGVFLPIPAGPLGEAHLQLVATDGSTNRTMKTPHLRNQYQKVGMELTQIENLAGFGFSHDGSADSLARFLSGFTVQNDQEIADLVALMLAFSGSDLPTGSFDPLDGEPPGPESLDTHAAVGRGVTFDGTNNADPAALALLTDLRTLADAGAIELVARARAAGLPRGYRYTSAGGLQSDRAAESTTVDALRTAAAPGTEVTFLAVPTGTAQRLALDRDADGFLDRDELDACSDPANAASLPPVGGCSMFSDGFESGGTEAWSLVSGG